MSRLAMVLSLLLLGAACADVSTGSSSAPTATSTSVVASSTSEPPIESRGSSTTTLRAGWPDWATSSVVEVDPVTLVDVGPAVPAGAWSEGSAVTDDLIAIATWPADGISWWRLVVASRDTGEVLFDERVGTMNILGMFTLPSGEVMVVEPIRSADWNFSDGFVVDAFNVDTNDLEEVARFDDGDFVPLRLTVLSDGRLGVVGWDRHGDTFQHRIIVFDWARNEVVVDVVLEGLPVEAEAPDGVYVDPMYHPVIWDEERSRILAVHAHEDVITTVGIPSGEIEEILLVPERSLLSAFFAWLVPAADAKGMPSFQRQAVISGDHLYVAGATVTFDETADGTYAYRHAPGDLLKIDLATMRIVESAQPGVSVIASSTSGGYLIGGGQTTTGQVGEELSTTESVEYAGLLVIDPDTLEVVDHHNEVNITWEGELQPSNTENIIYVDDHAGDILTFDPISGDLLSTGVRGFEYSLMRNSLRYTSPGS
ncbi:MAG TPA: hypothetical protein VM848_07765 [Acidimicrobiia bacterium]|nr:hypothetical protein [Acidimicrobiia bacterium]